MEVSLCDTGFLQRAGWPWGQCPGIFHRVPRTSFLSEPSLTSPKSMADCQALGHPAEGVCQRKAWGSVPRKGPGYTELPLGSWGSCRVITPAADSGETGSFRPLQGLGRCVKWIVKKNHEGLVPRVPPRKSTRWQPCEGSRVMCLEPPLSEPAPACAAAKACGHGRGCRFPWSECPRLCISASALPRPNPPTHARDSM